MIYQCLQCSIGVSHASEALARCYVGRNACELDVDTNCQCVREVALILGSNMIQYRTRLVFCGEMRSLLRWFCYPDIYHLLITLRDDLSCCLDILRNMKSASN